MELSKTPAFGLETPNCHAKWYRERVDDMISKNLILANDPKTQKCQILIKIITANVGKGLSYLPIIGAGTGFLNALAFCNNEVRQKMSIHYLVRDAIQVCSLGLAGPLLAFVDLVVTIVRENRDKKHRRLVLNHFPIAAPQIKDSLPTFILSNMFLLLPEAFLLKLQKAGTPIQTS